MSVFQWDLGIVILQASDGATIITLKVLDTADIIAPQIVNTTGRGDSIAGSYRTGNLLGNGFVKGKMISTTLPIPTNLAGFEGQMVYTLNSGQSPTKSITVNVLISKFSATRDQPGQNSPDVEFHFQHNGNYTLPDGSTTATPPTLSIKETDQGETKVVDRYGYEDQATRRYDIPNASDTDSYEQMITSALRMSGLAPMSGLIPDLANFLKTDRGGGAVTVTYRRTNSSLRRTLPQTTTDTDPNDIRSRQQIPVEYTVGGSPVAPSTPSGMSLITYHDMQFNGTHAMRVYFYGKNSSVDDLNNPHFRDHTDVSDLSSTHSESAVFNQGSPPSAPANPSGLYLSFYDDIRVTVAGTPHWVRVWLYEKMTAKMKLEIGNSDYFIDPNQLTSRARNAKLDGTPVLTSGFVDRGTLYDSITSAHTLEVTQGGLRSTADDITMGNTVISTDPLNLQSRGQQTIVVTSAAAAALVTTSAITPVPSGQKPRLISIRQINRKKTQVTQQSGKKSTIDDVQMPRTVSTRSSINPYIDTVAQVVTTSAANTAVAIANTNWAAFQQFTNNYDMRVEKLNDQETLIVYRYVANGTIVVMRTIAAPRLITTYNSSDHAKVYVRSVIQIATGLYRVFLCPKVTTVPVQRISIIRTFLATSAPLYFPQFWTTNASSFVVAGITYSAKTLLFTGSRIKTNTALATGGNLSFQVVYDFVYDSLGTFQVAIDGYSTEVLTSATVSTGWQSVSALTGANITETIPSTSDFSVFLA